MVFANDAGRVFGGVLVGGLCQCGDCAFKCCVLEMWRCWCERQVLLRDAAQECVEVLEFTGGVVLA